jgi:hypothetical protein
VRLALLLLPAACQNQPQNLGNAQPAAPAAANAVQPRDDLARAYQAVQRQLGNVEDLTFTNARVYGDERVPIVCGTVARDRGRSERYIVVGGEEAFIEPQMRAGEMDRAAAEFCRERNGQ